MLSYTFTAHVVYEFILKATNHLLGCDAKVISSVSFPPNPTPFLGRSMLDTAKPKTKSNVRSKTNILNAKSVRKATVYYGNRDRGQSNTQNMPQQDSIDVSTLCELLLNAYKGT
jgi:hypothetical protein